MNKQLLFTATWEEWPCKRIDLKSRRDAIQGLLAVLKDRLLVKGNGHFLTQTSVTENNAFRRRYRKPTIASQYIHRAIRNSHVKFMLDNRQF